VRFVRTARRVANEREAMIRMVDKGFDPDGEILLHDAPDIAASGAGDPSGAGANASTAQPIVTAEDSREIVIKADAPSDGFLLLADTFYPGWAAEVDGKPVPLYRANVSLRGIALPKGAHEVRFVYGAPGFYSGVQLSVLAVSLLLLWAGCAAYADRRGVRQP
jgi:hypothetical protein